MSLEVQMLHIFIPITIASRLIPLFCLLCSSHPGKPCFLQPAYLLVTSMSWPYHLSIWALGGANVQEIYFWVLDARGLEAASGPWGGLVGGGGVGKDPAPGWTTILLSVSRERGCQPHHTTAPVEAEQGRRRKKGQLRQTEARRRAKVWRRGWVDFGEVGQGDGRSLQSPSFARSRWDKCTWAFPIAWSSNMCDGLPQRWWWVNKGIASTHKYTHTGAKTTCTTTCQLQAPSNCFTFKIKGNIAMIALCVF